MEFCPKCGSVIIEKKKKFGCSRCSYKAKGKIKIEASEKINLKPSIGVIRDKDTDVSPIINTLCPKCGNKEAYFWTSQLRAGDEGETKFYRCTKCKHTWRDRR